MRRLVIVLPILLAACLLAVWLLSDRSPRSSNSARLTQTQRSTDIPESGQAAPPATPFSAPEAGESEEEKEVRALLRELSELARRIEKENLHFSEIRSKTSQPDATMWKLRVLAHQHPETIKVVQRYVRSDEPLAAKIFALFSFVAPQNAETIELVASIMRNAPSDALANASCLCCDAWAANGIGDAWNSLFRTYFSMLGLPKHYFIGENGFTYFPDDWKDHEGLYKSHSFKLDLTPIVSSILTLLSNAGDGVWRNKWMNMACQIMNHPKATPKDKERLTEIVDRWYLELDPGSGWDPAANCYRVGNGWHAAMEALTRSATPRQLQIIGAGLARLKPDQKAMVLDEVAHRVKSGLFEPPFSDHLEDALTHLARRPEDGAPGQGTYMHLCVATVIYAPNEEWTRQFLAGRSTVIRQRVAEGIASWATGGDYGQDKGRPFFAAAELLLADDSFNVRLSAATTMYGLTRKRNQVLSPEDLAKAREYLDSWVAKESSRNLTPAESEHLKRFIANLQR